MRRSPAAILRPVVLRPVVSCLLILLSLAPAGCYSVLSHEAMVDALWSVKIRTILLARYPGATPEEMKEAHGYAYGGAIIQDMGFYPHGNGYFSDLTHYVRAGDFIANLIRNAQSLNDLAFALGALSHFAGDCDGHREGTNVVEPKLYPKLGRKYGSVMTYEQNPARHVQSEYSFDVIEVAKGNFAPEAYHAFIGFNVATPLLEEAFRETYGFELRAMFGDFPKAIGSYRRSISKLLPLATRIAWAQHRDEIQRAQPGATREHFLYVMSRSSYERYWGKQYDRPTLLDRLLAFLIKWLPPVGPLRTLRFEPLTPPLQETFRHSFDVAVTHYQRKLDEVAPQRLAAAGGGALAFGNPNFDTGAVMPPAVYRLQDETYAYWLDEAARTHFQSMPAEAKSDLLAYYANLNLPFATKRKPKAWKQVLLELSELRSTLPTSATPTFTSTSNSRQVPLR